MEQWKLIGCDPEDMGSIPIASAPQWDLPAPTGVKDTGSAIAFTIHTPCAVKCWRAK